jgi:hypothetical protein
LDVADYFSLPIVQRDLDAGTRLPSGTNVAPGALSGMDATPGASPGAFAAADPTHYLSGATAPEDPASQVVANSTDRTLGRTTATAPQAVAPVVNAHGMHTRGKDRFRQPMDQLNLHAATATSLIPSSICAALADPALQFTMQTEFDALKDNDTWTLVPRPPGCQSRDWKVGLPP